MFVVQDRFINWTPPVAAKTKSLDLAGASMGDRHGSLGRVAIGCSDARSVRATEHAGADLVTHRDKIETFDEPAERTWMWPSVTVTVDA